MKKIHKISKILVIILIFSSIVSLIGCSDSESKTLKTTGISIIQGPTKLEYMLGEVLDDTGLVVVENFINGTTKLLSSDEYSITGFDSSIAGEQDITVTYEEYSQIFKVLIHDEEEQAPSSSVTIKDYPEYILDSKSKSTTIGADDVFTEDFEDAANLMVTEGNSMAMLTTEEGVAIDGRSLLMDSSAAYGRIYLTNTIKFEEGKTYKIEFDYKILNMASYYVKVLNGTFSDGQEQQQFGSSATGVLKHYKGSVTIGSKSSSELPYIRIQKGSREERAIIVIDNISICETEKVNYSFLSKDSPTTLPEGGTFMDDFEGEANIRMTTEKADISVTSDEAIAIDGTSLVFDSSEVYGRTYWKNSVDWEIGKSYTLEFDYKIIECADFVTLKFYDNGPQVRFGGTEEFNTVYHMIYSFDVYETISSGAPMFRIQKGDLAEKCILVIDNVSIKETSNVYNFTAMNPTTIESGETFVEDFESYAKMKFSTDGMDFNLTEEEGVAISDRSLILGSDYEYGKIYITNSVDFVPGTKYTIEFDYRVLEMADMFYLSFYDGEFTNGLNEVEFGDGPIGEVCHFSYDFTVFEPITINAPIFRIMKGALLENNRIVIDNITIKVAD